MFIVGGAAIVHYSGTATLVLDVPSTPNNRGCARRARLLKGDQMTWFRKTLMHPLSISIFASAIIFALAYLISPLKF